MKFRYYFRDMPFSAEVDPHLGIIGFAKVKNQPWQKDTMEEFIGDIMHELVHIWCWRNGKFRAYHRWPRTRAEKIAHIATAYRAEMWVDREARRLTKMFFGLKYKLLYTDTPSDRNWFDKHYLDPLRKEWKIGKYRKKRS